VNSLHLFDLKSNNHMVRVQQISRLFSLSRCPNMFLC